MVNRSIRASIVYVTGPDAIRLCGMYSAFMMALHCGTSHERWHQAARLRSYQRQIKVFVVPDNMLRQYIRTIREQVRGKETQGEEHSRISSHNSIAHGAMARQK